MWKAGRQSVPALSTAESELQEAIEGLVMGDSVDVLIQELVRAPYVKLVKIDNQAAASLISEPAGSWRTRHLRLRAAHLRWRIQRGDWLTEAIPGGEQLADVGTKVMTSPKLEEMRRMIDREIPVAAAEALGSFGKKAKEAAPILAKAIHYYLWEYQTTWEKDRYFRQRETAFDVAVAAAKALSAMGEEAAPAIPVLRKVATTKRYWYKEKLEAGKALQAIGEAASLNSMCCCINRQCRMSEMGSTGLWAVDHSPPGLERPEEGRCCKVYTDKCTRGYKSLVKKAPEVQPDFQACEASSAVAQPDAVADSK